MLDSVDSIDPVGLEAPIEGIPAALIRSRATCAHPSSSRSHLRLSKPSRTTCTHTDMAIIKSRLGFYDLLHRGAVFGLVGITGWGIFMMGAAHFSIMRRGEGASSLLALVCVCSCNELLLIDAEVRLRLCRRLSVLC